MSMTIALGVMVTAIVLLSIERIPIEVSSLAIIVLLVLSGLPGRYRFRDFLRVGTPLTLLMLALLTVGVPLVWPFTGR